MNSITLNDGLHITIWSLFINLQKTEELVFRRPNPRLVLPVPLDQMEQVHCAKLLGSYLSDTLQYETHLVNLLKICSQKTYLLKLLSFSMIRVCHVHTSILFLGP